MARPPSNPRRLERYWTCFAQKYYKFLSRVCEIVHDSKLFDDPIVKSNRQRQANWWRRQPSKKSNRWRIAKWEFKLMASQQGRVLFLWHLFYFSASSLASSAIISNNFTVQLVPVVRRVEKNEEGSAFFPRYIMRMLEVNRRRYEEVYFFDNPDRSPSNKKKHQRFILTLLHCWRRRSRKKFSPRFVSRLTSAHITT